MQISWINKFTLIDFPWHTACIIFTPWCNFRCWFCHNSEFVLPEKLEKVYKNLITEEAFFSFLKTRKWLLDWVSICWWEPTMQKDLFEFCKKVKEMWFLVKLDTNWRDPEILKKLISHKYIDYIAMDVKHEIWKFSESAWLKINEEKYLESIKILLDLEEKSWVDYEFRTTVAKWIHDEKTIENITKYLSWAKNYFLQNYKKWEKWTTLDPNFKWESFSQKELEKFLEIWKKFVKNIWIRN